MLERFLYFQSKWLKSQNLVVVSLAKSDMANNWWLSLVWSNTLNSLFFFFLHVTRSLKSRFNYCFITITRRIRLVDLRNQRSFITWQRYRLKVLRSSVGSIQTALWHHCIIIFFFVVCVFLYFLQYDKRVFQSFISSLFLSFLLKTNFIFHQNHFLRDFL